MQEVSPFSRRRPRSPSGPASPFSPARPAHWQTPGSVERTEINQDHHQMMYGCKLRYFFKTWAILFISFLLVEHMSTDGSSFEVGEALQISHLFFLAALPHPVVLVNRLYQANLTIKRIMTVERSQHSLSDKCCQLTVLPGGPGGPEEWINK